MKHNPEQLRAWARFEAQPTIEARVLAAVMTEPEKLAVASELEIADFADPRNQHVFAALRNLQVGEHEVSATAIAEYLTMDATRKGISGSGELRELHEKFLDYLFALLVTAPTYEGSFGAAAIGVFQADLRQLRLIAKERARV